MLLMGMNEKCTTYSPLLMFGAKENHVTFWS